MGLDSVWAKDKKIGASLINARAETVAVKPAFMTAFNKWRCLIPAHGFCEWKKVGTGKVPHRITVGDGLFFFVGHWEIWSDPKGGPLKTCPSNGGQPFPFVLNGTRHALYRTAVHCLNSLPIQGLLEVGIISTGQVRRQCGNIKGHCHHSRRVGLCCV